MVSLSWRCDRRAYISVGWIGTRRFAGCRWVLVERTKNTHTNNTQQAVSTFVYMCSFVHYEHPFWVRSCRYPSPFLVSALWVPSVSPIALLFIFFYHTYRIRCERFNEEHAHKQQAGTPRICTYFLFVSYPNDTVDGRLWSVIKNSWPLVLPALLYFITQVGFCLFSVSLFLLFLSSPLPVI